MNPLVSVIMPTYNCAQYISEAVESILSQSYGNYEIIVVDDGSIDNTEEVLQPYRERITFIQQKNAGPSTARNRGIKESKGQIIAFLDADDIWYPDRLKTAVEYLLSHPEVKVVSSDVDFFDTSGIVIKRQITSEKQVYEGYIYDKLFLENFISTITITFWKECLQKSGLFDTSLKGPEDFDLWLRIAYFYRYAFIPENLAGYRMRAGSLVSGYEDFLKARIKIIRKHADLFSDYFLTRKNLIRQAEANLFFRYGYNFFHARKMDLARECFLNVIKNKPGLCKSYLYLIASFLPKQIHKLILNSGRKR